MAAASAVTPTGMAAVLGGDPDDVLATLERHGLTPANVNGAGQTVAAGTLEQLEALTADPPAKARHPAPGRGGLPHPPHGACGQRPRGAGRDHADPPRRSRSCPTRTAGPSPMAARSSTASCVR